MHHPTYRLLGLAVTLCTILPKFASAAASPIPLTTASYNQDVVVELGASDPSTSVTATMDGGTFFKTGFTWYEKGFNSAAPATGLPKPTTITSQRDPTAHFNLLPYITNNVRLFEVPNSTGTLTLATPGKYSALSLLGASANGPGLLNLTLHFSDGSADLERLPLTVPDWFDSTPPALTADGRVNVTGAFDAVGTGNPRLFQLDVPLPAGAETHPLASIDVTWTGTQTNATTAIFALSGTPTPEPGSVLCLSLAALSALARRRRR